MNARDREAERQERLTFEQRRRQDHQWHVLRLVMGYCATILLSALIAALAAIAVVAVPFGSDSFSPKIITGAGGAILTVIAAMFALWKIVLSGSFISRLSPVTTRESAATPSSPGENVFPARIHRPRRYQFAALRRRPGASARVRQKSV